MTNIPTSTEDVVTTTNPQETKTEITGTNQDGTAANGDVDYKVKFGESSREALRLLEEKKALEAELEEYKKQNQPAPATGNDLQTLYPGFDLLGDEERKNLIAYTESIAKKVSSDIYKDPAIAFAKASYNEKTWDSAFDKVKEKFPDLDKAEFKQKYFKADNVPSNIEKILEDVAKIHLFDKAKDIGAKEAMEQQERIEIERQGGGDKTPKAGRSLEDWQRLAASNPAKFAQLSKEYNADLASGKLK